MDRIAGDEMHGLDHVGLLITLANDVAIQTPEGGEHVARAGDAKPRPHHVEQSDHGQCDQGQRGAPDDAHARRILLERDDGSKGLDRIDDESCEREESRDGASRHADGQLCHRGQRAKASADDGNHQPN